MVNQMDNKEIRRKILEYIHEKNQESPQCMVNREEFKESLGVNDVELDRNILYLEEKGYLKLLKTLSERFRTAQITSFGTDLVENPEEFNSEFPIKVTQNIVQNSTGVIIGDNNRQSISISQSFEQIYETIEKRNPKNKEQIVEEVREIEEELKQPNPNKSKIAKSIEYLKSNASWIVPVIIEVLTKAFGG
jgi:tyrosyl-tRNA synthetase